MEIGTVANPHKNKLKKKLRERLRNYPASDLALDLPSGNLRVRVAVYICTNLKSFCKETHRELDLQERYYEDFIDRLPGYKLVRFYRDYSRDTARPHFERMLNDCRAGKIDLIITKSISRFAPNIKGCMETIKMLRRLQPAVGVYFETENIYTLKNNALIKEESAACLDEQTIWREPNAES